MMYPFSGGRRAPTIFGGGWTVKVTDESQRPVMTVIFPVHFEPGEPKPAQAEGARTLLLRLGAALTASALLDRSPRQPRRHS